jgi:hypothetical protein
MVIIFYTNIKDICLKTGTFSNSIIVSTDNGIVVYLDYYFSIILELAQNRKEL